MAELMQASLCSFGLTKTFMKTHASASEPQMSLTPITPRRGIEHIARAMPGYIQAHIILCPERAKVSFPICTQGVALG